MKPNGFLKWFAPGVILLGFLFAVYHQFRNTTELAASTAVIVKEVEQRAIENGANNQTTAEILQGVVTQQQWLSAEIMRQQREQGIIEGTLDGHEIRIDHLEDDR